MSERDALKSSQTETSSLMASYANGLRKSFSTDNVALVGASEPISFNPRRHRSVSSLAPGPPPRALKTEEVFIPPRLSHQTSLEDVRDSVLNIQPELLASALEATATSHNNDHNSNNSSRAGSRSSSRSTSPSPLAVLAAANSTNIVPSAANVLINFDTPPLAATRSEGIYRVSMPSPTPVTKSQSDGSLFVSTSATGSPDVPTLPSPPSVITPKRPRIYSSPPKFGVRSLRFWLPAHVAQIKQRQPQAPQSASDSEVATNSKRMRLRHLTPMDMLPSNEHRSWENLALVTPLPPSPQPSDIKLQRADVCNSSRLLLLVT